MKEIFDMADLSCTQESCTTTIKTFMVYDQDWNEQKMSVSYESYPSREIYKNGNKFRKFYNFVSKIYSGEISLYHCGNVISGPCEGAIFFGTVHSSNPNHEACLKKPGLTRVDSDFAFLNIKSCGKDFIACSGAGYQTFTPGLRS